MLQGERHVDTLGIAAGFVALSLIASFIAIVGLMAMVFIGTTAYLGLLLPWRYFQARHAIMHDLLGRYSAGKLERLDIRYDDWPGCDVQGTTFVAATAHGEVTISVNQNGRSGYLELAVKGDSHVLGGQLRVFLNAFQVHTNRCYAVLL